MSGLICNVLTYSLTSPTFKQDSLFGQQMSGSGPIIMYLIEIQKSPEDNVLVRQTDKEEFEDLSRTTCVVFPWWESPTTSASELVTCSPVMQTDRTWQ